MSKEVVIENIANVPEMDYAKEGDGGIDCYAAEDVTLSPGEIKAIPLGVKVQLPSNCVAISMTKSGLFKKGLFSVTGLIDSGYRGQIHSLAINMSQEVMEIPKGQKVCQIMVLEIPKVEIKYGEVSNDTERGETGFGSSGI